MFYEIRKAWFRKRWHVYKVMQPDAETWVASFRTERAARDWLGQMEDYK